jgi:general secretion pathway protein L
MSILVVLLPARARLGVTPAEAAERAPAEFSYVLSPDGLSVGSQGRTAPSLLPRADSVVAAVADSDLSWHRVTLPKMPPARLRAALVGLLEEVVLDEPELLHFALAPGATAGQPAWVAAMHKPWLALQLAALEKANVAVERVVPMSWPDAMALGHFSGGADVASMRLTWSDIDGVASINLQGGLARALLPQWQTRTARWSATPAVAAPAERWLGAPVLVLTEEQRALQAARSLWNLRQFELAPRHRGTLALRDAWRRFQSPGWRPIRIGLATLVALQLVALNLWAWHQHRQIDAKRDRMVQLLRSTHPQVRAVLDAPVQMQRETDALRAAAGRPGDNDLEVMLQAAAAAWPEGGAPVDTLRFEPGRLTLSATGWTPAQVERFRAQLRSAGWAVDAAEGRLTLRRASPGAMS